VAALLGVLVLHETLSIGMVIGLGLVILGSALATRTTQRRRVESEDGLAVAQPQ
jgi:threonine/homoserine efflux transporter RhtA